MAGKAGSFSPKPHHLSLLYAYLSPKPAVLTQPVTLRSRFHKESSRLLVDREAISSVCLFVRKPRQGVDNSEDGHATLRSCAGIEWGWIVNS